MYKNSKIIFSFFVKKTPYRGFLRLSNDSKLVLVFILCISAWEQSGQVHFNSLNPSFMKDLLHFASRARSALADIFFSCECSKNRSCKATRLTRSLAERFCCIGKFRELSHTTKKPPYCVSIRIRAA